MSLCVCVCVLVFSSFSWSLCWGSSLLWGFPGMVTLWAGSGGLARGACRPVVLFPAVGCVFGGFFFLRWSEGDEVRWAELYGNSGHVYYLNTTGPLGAPPLDTEPLSPRDTAVQSADDTRHRATILITGTFHFCGCGASRWAPSWPTTTSWVQVAWRAFARRFATWSRL
jgi:hypothetical protein